MGHVMYLCSVVFRFNFNGFRLISHFFSGPFRVNGVPIRRVNQTYVIATSTKTDISGVDVSKFDDKYFTREKKKVTKTEGELFETEKEVGSNLVFSVSYMLQYSPCL
jgi:hypothetical protein